MEISRESGRVTLSRKRLGEDPWTTIRDNYTVDENPGLGQKTVYYYYMVLAKALQAVGDPVIVDSRGRSHVCRLDPGPLAGMFRAVHAATGHPLVRHHRQVVADRPRLAVAARDPVGPAGAASIASRNPN